MDVRHTVRCDTQVTAGELHREQPLETPLIALADDGLESAGLLQGRVPARREGARRSAAAVRSVGAVPWSDHQRCACARGDAICIDGRPDSNAEPRKSRGERTQHESKNEHDGALFHVAVDELPDAWNEERHNRCQDGFLPWRPGLGGGDRRGSTANARIGSGSGRPLATGVPHT